MITLTVNEYHAVWFERHSSWENQCLEEFSDKYPSMEGGSVEFCEDGTAYVHGGAYPMIIKDAVTPWSESEYWME